MKKSAVCSEVQTARKKKRKHEDQKKKNSRHSLQICYGAPPFKSRNVVVSDFVLGSILCSRLSTKLFLAKTKKCSPSALFVLREGAVAGCEKHIPVFPLVQQTELHYG